MKRRFNRAPAADWRTEDLHALWARTKPIEIQNVDIDLHSFLRYCSLLQQVRKSFDAGDAIARFDHCAFFLRGGYLAFTYLNLTTALFPRATIFGGLNHGRHPKLAVPPFIDEIRQRALSGGAGAVHLLIVDEVKSGTGIATALKAIKRAMRQSSQTGCDIDVTVFAIRSGSRDSISPELRSVIRKWRGQVSTRNGEIRVQFEHFAGPWLAYDNAQMCGIKKVSKGSSETEAYELVKVNGGTVKFWCSKRRRPIMQVPLGANCVAEFLSSCAIKWTTCPSSILTRNLELAAERWRCDTCGTLLRAAMIGAQ
jgi:hypothetical protein